MDTDSFECSSSDPCGSLNCSHECGFDYTAKTYVCTCPPNMKLDSTNSECVDTKNNDTSSDSNLSTPALLDAANISTSESTLTPSFVDSETTTQRLLTPEACVNGTCDTGDNQNVMKVTTLFPEDNQNNEISTLGIENEETTMMTTPYYHHVIDYHPHPHFYHSYNVLTGSKSSNKQNSSNTASKSNGVTNNDDNNKERGSSTKTATSSSTATTTTTASTTMKPRTTVFPSLTTATSATSLSQSSGSKHHGFKQILPVYLPPHHHHDKTKTLINYHNKLFKMDDVPSMMKGGDIDKMTVEALAVENISEAKVDENVVEDNNKESVFMFDCIKAVNNEIMTTLSQVGIY